LPKHSRQHAQPRVFARWTPGKDLAVTLGRMSVVDLAMSFWRTRAPRRIGLALAGGGVVGGMYEVGALSALEERLNGAGRGFDLYVGCSAGSVVASLLAGGVRAREIYQILDEDLEDRKSTRLNSSHVSISYAVFCLKKKKKLN